MLKRILMLLLSILFIGTISCAAEQNLLENPGFELLDAYGIPIGWFTDAYLTRDGVSEYSLVSDARTGNRAACVTNNNMNDARFAQSVPVQPNTMYRLSGWIRTKDISDTGRGANLSVAGVYAFSKSLYGSQSEWTYVETYGLTGPDQNELTVFARVGGYSGESEGNACFDDLRLEVVTSLPTDVVADAWYVQETIQVVNPVDAPSSGNQPFWPWLLVISTVYAIICMCLMRHLQLDRRKEVLQASEGHTLRQMPVFVICGLVIAALARMLVAMNVDGYQVDVNCFTAWGNTMASVGPALFYQSNWCDYTPGYIYIMGLNSLLVQATNGLISSAFAHKILPMTCDLLAAVLLYKLATDNGQNRRQAGLLVLLFAFNPATFLNSAAWCQIDSVLSLGLMLVAYLSLQRKWVAVLPLYVLCILIKPQALMLGFLGLTALVQEWRSCQPARRSILIGIALSALVALGVVLPFCPNQDSPFWLFELYQKTLESYPHATVNTANIFYLFNANWDGIENPAAPGACVFFFLCAAVWGVISFLRQRKNVKLWYIEPALMMVYALLYLLLSIIGCSWAVLGILTMSMAFAVVLPMYIRAVKVELLSLCGAVIFILLYVFGIKMHERYLFPAIFLLGMAYAIRRDRGTLLMLIAASCVLFVNEGIILDNSLRLGSSMGHLNADNVTLGKCLSVINVGLALFSVFHCYRICVEGHEVQLSKHLTEGVFPVRMHVNQPCTPLDYQGEPKVRFGLVDCLLILAVTAVYAVVTLTTLGSTKAPQTTWKSSATNERVYIDLGQHYDDFSLLYFSQVSYYPFAVAVSDVLDTAEWSDDYPVQVAEGMCFSWQYMDPSYQNADGTPNFVNATDFADVQKLSGRYIRLTAKQVNLALNELIFKDATGNIINGVSVVGRENANDASPFYSDPAHLLDEQDTLEGEPSWWNSTYFDEIYHARTAYEHLNATTAYEWTHPPLGKILMSWSIAIFGMTPFGWRFAGAVAGILMLPAMYLLAKQLTKRKDMAFLAMMLMALDCMHFTQTRIATIDSFPVLFIILSYFFMLRFMQRDIVAEKLRSILPDLALCGFFMGCSVSSKWIGAYAGIGLAVLYFWTCIRHIRLGKESARRLEANNTEKMPMESLCILQLRKRESFKRIVILCLWCLLFFVAVPLAMYLWTYTIHYAYMSFESIGDFFKVVINCQENILSYHSTPGMGMDHAFYSPWYEWPLMNTPMYYASAAFKPIGKSYAIFCFGNPWVWCIGLLGIAFTLYKWLQGHRYLLADKDGTFQLMRDDWHIEHAFILIGLLAQFLPWVLVPRGTYIYHYFASIPFLILGIVLMFSFITKQKPAAGRRLMIVYLCLCLIWFVLLFPYASGVTVDEEWLALIRDYPFISNIPNYWQNDLLVQLNSFLENIPIMPHVYYH